MLAWWATCQLSHRPNPMSLTELMKWDETHKDLYELSSGPISLGWCFVLIDFWQTKEWNQMEADKYRCLPQQYPADSLREHFPLGKNKTKLFGSIVNKSGEEIESWLCTTGISPKTSMVWLLDTHGFSTVASEHKVCATPRWQLLGTACCYEQSDHSMARRCVLEYFFLLYSLLIIQPASVWVLFVQHSPWTMA